jgi:hypothetical protein
MKKPEPVACSKIIVGRIESFLLMHDRFDQRWTVVFESNCGLRRRATRKGPSRAGAMICSILVHRQRIIVALILTFPQANRTREQENLNSVHLSIS